MFFKIACLILTALLWGATNPFIKRGSSGIIKVKASSAMSQFFQEIKYLATNFQYLVPMGLNQLGSILYIYTLQYTDLSLAVPVANSLSFVFTALSGWCLGETPASKSTYIGVLMIITGTSLCCYDKYVNEEDVL